MDAARRPNSLAHRATARRTAVAALAGTIALLTTASPARTVPIFARKYETSCQTCHVAFPKLNPFGEAFRRNGHRFPGGEDEESVKHEPVPMGQPAHRRVFPAAVWPGELPATPPVAAQMASSIALQPSGTSRISFAGVGASLGLNLAASLGDSFSAWAGATLLASTRPQGGETVSIGLERIFVSVTPFDQPWAILRVGRIEAGALGLTMHRTLGLAPWISSSTIGDDPFTLDPAQLGLEASGVLAAGRLSYAAGAVEGANTALNTAKDVYARVAYKVGGMRLDGVGGAKESDPWRERSAILGAFGYRGQSLVGDPTLATQEDRFWLAGLDANLTFRDANLVLAYARGRNARPLLSRPNDSLSSWHAFSQLDYVVYRWLIPTLRYERRGDNGPDQSRVSGGVYLLLRAHVRTQILASATDTGTGLQFNQLLGGLNLAF